MFGAALSQPTDTLGATAPSSHLQYLKYRVDANAMQLLPPLGKLVPRFPNHFVVAIRTGTGAEPGWWRGNPKVIVPVFWFPTLLLQPYSRPNALYGMGHEQCASEADLVATP